MEENPIAKTDVSSLNTVKQPTGRREMRAQRSATKVHFAPGKIDKATNLQITGTIRRAQPKRPAGVSARQWKRQQHAMRQQ